MPQEAVAVPPAGEDLLPDPTLAFPPGTPLIAMPNWRMPRVLLAKSGGPLGRWRASGFYPATRSAARLYRLGLRGKAAAGLGETRRAAGERWHLGEFVADRLPPLGSIALQTPRLGLVRRYTIELRDRGDAILGYVKFGTDALARERLEQEYAMLLGLPPGLGPTPLKFGDLAGGKALLVAPVPGRGVSARLPPEPTVADFALSLVNSAPVPLAGHPYVGGIRQQFGAQLDPVFADLADRNWPVAIQHGDLAPWNLRRDPVRGTLRAFDWESGRLDGFPFVDLAFFILQVAFLIHSWPAVKSAVFALEWLQRQPQLALGERHARALVRLAMFEAHHRARSEGLPDQEPLQLWRRRLWRGLW